LNLGSTSESNDFNKVRITTAAIKGKEGTRWESEKGQERGEEREGRGSEVGVEPP